MGRKIQMCGITSPGQVQTVSGASPPQQCQPTPATVVATRTTVESQNIIRGAYERFLNWYTLLTVTSREPGDRNQIVNRASNTYVYLNVIVRSSRVITVM